MKRSLLITFLFLIYASFIYPQSPGWKIAGNKISTPWADKVDPINPLPEYPRPQMVRNEWKSLNGLWDYAIVQANAPRPEVFQGKILIPFAPESALSGVGKPVGPDNALWYSTRFTIPSGFKKKHILLHFGAVDWSSEMFVNGKQAGSHKGGYDPFWLDITSFIRGSGLQTLELKVTDPVDKGPQPRGKQVLKPAGIWYTSVTGIWRSVWIEAVPETYIEKIKITPDIDNQRLLASVEISGSLQNEMIGISAWDGNQMVAENEAEFGKPVILSIKKPKLWSPENPFLYDLKITISRNGKPVDQVKSYFAMRKISLDADENGVQRMMLNNKFVFQYGPLDQGWWPDGLYTAPTDESLLFDIVKTKEMGFNMIRKHVKTEPERWYYHCDSIGMLVWQDMPSGDHGGGKWNANPGMEGGSDKTRTGESENIFRTEWNAIIESLYNHPCIVVWVPFNEAWGQFKTVEITKWTMEKDPSRLVNSASGGNFHQAGQILDMHNYPGPVMPKPEIFGASQALALGEFGGLGLPLEGHTWLDKNNWGYRSFHDADTLFMTYDTYLNQIVPFIRRGLSAAIYTQTTDVEIECNGLMTYDRRVIKVPEKKLNTAAMRLYDAAGTVNFKKK
ncbi:MAG TPA: glycoside hydrolase family 2 TIM barrel-domain containing protein [Bacteroidales bacterium]|nr:glycoside hydrolase family 2 TIM barrel-domain containing protein [Bacteroidales bacterium]